MSDNGEVVKQLRELFDPDGQLPGLCVVGAVVRELDSNRRWRADVDRLKQQLALQIERRTTLENKVASLSHDRDCLILEFERLETDLASARAKLAGPRLADGTSPRQGMSVVRDTGERGLCVEVQIDDREPEWAISKLDEHGRPMCPHSPFDWGRWRVRGEQRRRSAARGSGHIGEIGRGDARCLYAAT